MRRARRVWRRVVTEVRWLRDQYAAKQDPALVEPDEQTGALGWAREQTGRPYPWSRWDDWSWAKEHEAAIRSMWMEPVAWDAAAEPEPSVRESGLSDEERAAWAEIVACWTQS